MPFFEKFCHLAFWQQLLSSDFNRGYLTAFALVFTIFLALLLLKILLWICFRTRRCGNITVKYDDGEVVISREAVTALLRDELRDFQQLEVESIRIYRRGEEYHLHLNADFRTGENGLQEVLDEAKPRLLTALKETLGIANVTKIKVTIDDLDQEEEEEAEERPARRRNSGGRNSGEAMITLPKSIGE